MGKLVGNPNTWGSLRARFMDIGWVRPHAQCCGDQASSPSYRCRYCSAKNTQCFDCLFLAIVWSCCFFEVLGSLSQLEYFLIFVFARSPRLANCDLYVVWLVQGNFQKKHNVGLVVGFNFHYFSFFNFVQNVFFANYYKIIFFHSLHLFVGF